MKTQTHTPGPWKVSSGSDGREIIFHSCGVSFPIAKVSDGLGKANGFKEAQVNARLIASAPDMLKALKMVKDKMEGWGYYVIVAIAKAEGRI